MKSGPIKGVPTCYHDGIKFASPLFSLKEEKEAGTGSPDQSPGKIIACLLVLSMIDYLMADYTFVHRGTANGALMRKFVAVVLYLR